METVESGDFGDVVVFEVEGFEKFEPVEGIDLADLVLVEVEGQEVGAETEIGHFGDFFFVE